jgi:hypothetical protein
LACQLTAQHPVAALLFTDVYHADNEKTRQLQGLTVQLDVNDGSYGDSSRTVAARQTLVSIRGDEQTIPADRDNGRLPGTPDSPKSPSSSQHRRRLLRHQALPATTPSPQSLRNPR